MAKTVLRRLDIFYNPSYVASVEICIKKCSTPVIFFYIFWVGSAFKTAISNENHDGNAAGRRRRDFARLWGRFQRFFSNPAVFRDFFGVLTHWMGRLYGGFDCTGNADF